jgi:hypothetical protein
MVIKGTLVVHARGSFGKEPTQASSREDGQWFVRKSFARALYVYKVTEFDAAGEKWLLENEVKPDPPPLPPAQQQLELGP